MNKTMFIIELSYRYLVRHKGINTVVLISISLGLLLPCLALANINVFFAKSETLKIHDPDSVIISQIVTQQNAVLPLAAIENCSDYALINKSNGMASWKEHYRSVSICHASLNIINYENFILINGRWVTKDEVANGEPVCMVSDGFIAHNGEISVGDTISYDNIEHTVIGVFRALNYYTCVLDFVTIPATINTDGTFFIYFRTLLDDKEIMNQLNKYGSTIISVESAQAVISNAIRRGYSDASLIFLVALLSLVFASINIASIVYGNFNLHIKRIGIELSLGSDIFDVFLINFLSDIILLLLSMPILVLELLIVRAIIPESIEMVFNISIYVITLCLGIFMCICMNLILLARIRKLRIIDVIGENI